MNRIDFIKNTLISFFALKSSKPIQKEDMKRVDDIIYDLLDTKTDELVTFSKVTLFADGTAMSDLKCDGVIYRKLGSEYFKRNFTGSIDVKWFGAKGDGISDDTVPIQNAFNVAIKTEKSLLVSPGIFKITSTLNFDLLNTVGFLLSMNGYIMPVAGIKYGLKIFNGQGLVGNINIKNGGQFVYCTTPVQDQSGADCAILLRGISGIKLDFNILNYTGRGFEILKEIGAEPKTDLVNLGVSNIIGVGQSFYINASSGFGCLGSMFIGEVNGGYVINTYDISIKKYENIMSGVNGIKFIACSTISIERIAIGEFASPLVEFQSCNVVTIQNGYAYGFGRDLIGFKFSTCVLVKANITTVTCGDIGIKTYNLRNSYINHRSYSDKIGLEIESSVKSEFNVYSYQPVERCIDIIPAVGANQINTELKITGNLESPSQVLESCINISDTVGTIELDIYADTATIVLPNKVKLVDDYKIISINGGAPFNQSVYIVGAVSLASLATLKRDITVSNVKIGDFVQVSLVAGNMQGIMMTAYAAAANTVTLVFFNPTGGTLNIFNTEYSIRFNRAYN